jgi:hypothetical protein
MHPQQATKGTSCYRSTLSRLGYQGDSTVGQGMFLHQATIQEMIIIDPFNFNLTTMNPITTT